MVRPRNRLKELYPSVPLNELSEILSRNNGDYERSNIEIQQLLQGRNQGNAEGTGVIELLSSSDDEGKGKGEEVELIDENELLLSSSDESEQFQEDIFFSWLNVLLIEQRQNSILEDTTIIWMVQSQSILREGKGVMSKILFMKNIRDRISLQGRYLTKTNRL